MQKEKNSELEKLRILFWGAPQAIDICNEDSTTQLLDRTGNNTGNLYIGYTTYNQLVFDKDSSKWLTSETFNDIAKLNKLSECYDLFVIPASNFFNNYADFDFIANFLEHKCDIPCVALGVGSQGEIDYKLNIKLKPGMYRFLKVLAEKSVSIGVRGEFTARCFESIGIHNIDIIGCPSFFYRPSAITGMKKKNFNDEFKFAFSSENYFRNPSLTKITHEFYSELIKSGGIYIAQNELELCTIARKNAVELTDSLKNQVKIFFNVNKQDITSDNFINQRIEVYFDIPSWEQRLRKLDFTVGARFHGNMIALQNGIPALLFVHDSRTRELSELFKIPNIFYEKIESFNIKILYDSFEIDTMKKNYNDLFQNYLSFLSKNGLEYVENFL